MAVGVAQIPTCAPSLPDEDPEGRLEAGAPRGRRPKNLAPQRRVWKNDPAQADLLIDGSPVDLADHEAIYAIPDDNGSRTVGRAGGAVVVVVVAVPALPGSLQWNDHGCWPVRLLAPDSPGPVVRPATLMH